jgi:hypothetical protein
MRAAARGLRSPWAGTVAMIDLCLPTGSGNSIPRRVFPPPFLPHPPPPPLRPSVRHRIDREVARPAGRSVYSAPVALPASVGRNVDAAAAAVRMPCAPCAASLSARSFIPWLAGMC